MSALTRRTVLAAPAVLRAQPARVLRADPELKRTYLGL